MADTRDKDVVVWMSVTSLAKIHYFPLPYISTYFLTPSYWARGKLASAILGDPLLSQLYHIFRVLYSAGARKGIYTVPTESPLSYLHGPFNSRSSPLLLCHCSVWESVFHLSRCSNSHSSLAAFFSLLSPWCTSWKKYPISKHWAPQILSFLPSIQQNILLVWGRSLFLPVPSETYHLCLGILFFLPFNFPFNFS